MTPPTRPLTTTLISSRYFLELHRNVNCVSNGEKQLNWAFKILARVRLSQTDTTDNELSVFQQVGHPWGRNRASRRSGIGRNERSVGGGWRKRTDRTVSWSLSGTQCADNGSDKNYFKVIQFKQNHLNNFVLIAIASTLHVKLAKRLG